MELLIFIIMVVVAIHFFSKGKRKKKLEYQITINGKPVDYSLDEDYEDPWESVEESTRDKIFEVEYPLFYALKNKKELFDYLSSDLHELAKLLSYKKSENVQNAVHSMLYQDSFKKMKGLPQYLQIVPIKSLISDQIFVNPSESDLPELLNSMTMDILKGYCSELDIKPARSKKETIEKLIDSPISTKIEYNHYFRLNPKIKEINEQFGNYCQVLNAKQLDKGEIRMKNISKPLDPENLSSKQEKGKYTVQEYGYNSVIYSKYDKPLFKIMLNEDALLLRNGKILVSENCRIDDWTAMRVSIIDENQKILDQFKIKDFNNYEVVELDNNPIVFLNLLNNNYWTLNYETLEEKYIDNPDNLDIYSLVGD
jgi:hypothetical protein